MWAHVWRWNISHIQTASVNPGVHSWLERNASPLMIREALELIFCSPIQSVVLTLQSNVHVHIISRYHIPCHMHVDVGWKIISSVYRATSSHSPNLTCMQIYLAGKSYWPTDDSPFSLTLCSILRAQSSPHDLKCTQISLFPGTISHLTRIG